MIRHINFYSLILLLFISCSVKSEKNYSNDSSFISNDIITDSLSTEITSQSIEKSYFGIWDCYKYGKDSRYDSNYGEGYAKEFSEFSKLRLTKDSLYIGRCVEKIRYYDYPTKFRRYDGESVFITYFKPTEDKVKFVSVQNINENNICLPIDNEPIYLENYNSIIIHDRGYFFYYRKDNENTHKEICAENVIGIPGNNRDYWNVELKTKRFNNIEEGYNYFMTNFTYGGKDLKDKIPIDAEYIDNKNSIIYKKNGNKLEIEKADPMGTIFIKMEYKEKEFHLIYRLDYPKHD
jgi:hypothetical protein